MKANMIEVENIMNLDFDLLGFCGFFESVHCFKFLLETKLFIIDQLVIECVVCGDPLRFSDCVRIQLTFQFSLQDYCYYHHVIIT